MREVSEDFLAARNRFQGTPHKSVKSHGGGVNKNSLNDISMNTLLKPTASSSTLPHTSVKVSSSSRVLKEEVVRSRSAPRISGTSHFVPVSNNSNNISPESSLNRGSSFHTQPDLKSPISLQERSTNHTRQEKTESFARPSIKSKSAPTSPAPQDVAKYRHCDSPKSISSSKSTNALRLNIDLWETLNGKADMFTLDNVKSPNGLGQARNHHTIGVKKSFDEISQGSSKSKEMSKKNGVHMESNTTTMNTPSIVQIPAVKKSSSYSSSTSPSSKVANAQIMSSRERFVGKGSVVLPDWNEMKQSCKNNNNVSGSKVVSLEKNHIEDGEEVLFKVIRHETNSSMMIKDTSHHQQKVQVMDETSVVTKSTMPSRDDDSIPSQKTISSQQKIPMERDMSQPFVHTAPVSPQRVLDSRTIVDTLMYPPPPPPPTDFDNALMNTSLLSRESKMDHRTTKIDLLLEMASDDTDEQLSSAMALKRGTIFRVTHPDHHGMDNNTVHLREQDSREKPGILGSARGKDMTNTTLPDWAVMAKSAKQGKVEKLQQPNDFVVHKDQDKLPDWTVMAKSAKQDKVEKLQQPNVTVVQKDQGGSTTPKNLPKPKDTMDVLDVFNVADPSFDVNVEFQAFDRTDWNFNQATVRKSQDAMQPVPMKSIPQPVFSKGVESNEKISDKFKTGGVNILYEDMSLTKQADTIDSEKLMKEIDMLRHALKVSEVRREAAEKLFLLREKEKASANISQESAIKTNVGGAVSLNLSNSSNTSDTTPSLNESLSSSYDVEQDYNSHGHKKSVSSGRKSNKNKTTFFRRTKKGFLLTGSPQRRNIFDFIFGCR